MKCIHCDSEVKKRGAKSCGPCYLGRFNRSPEMRAKSSQRMTERWAGRSWGEISLGEKKKRVLEEQDGKCLHCGVGAVWNGQPLVLHLDHIDGETENNDRSNLRGLCPNCHSQTPTYAGRSAGKKVSGDARARMIAGSRRGAEVRWGRA